MLSYDYFVNNVAGGIMGASTQYEMLLEYMTPFINEQLDLALDITDWDVMFVEDVQGFDFKVRMFTNGLTHNLNIYLAFQLGTILRLSTPQFEDTVGLNNELTTTAIINGESIELLLTFTDKVSYVVSGTINQGFYRAPSGNIKPTSYVVSNPATLDSSLQLLTVNASEILTINSGQALLIQ
jgi:hypothetical protein